jgi:hypothetical protein
LKNNAAVLRANRDKIELLAQIFVPSEADVFTRNDLHDKDKNGTR